MRLQTIYEKIHVGPQGFKWIELKTGNRIMFSDAETKSERAISNLTRWMSRMFKLVGDHEFSEYDLEAIDRTLYRLETLTGHWRHELDKRSIKKTKQERIAALRKVEGRTEEEAAIYLTKADQLEKELDG